MIDNKDLTFVIQGNKRPEIYKCISSIRKYFSGSHIIFSTWAGTDIADIDCDEVVFNIDPGDLGNEFVQDINSSRSHLNNINRQIVSSYNGLLHVKTKYAVKVRPDLIFSTNSMLELYDRYEKLDLKRDNRWTVFKNRILMLSPNNLNVPYAYYICDLILLGHTEDLTNFWNIPLMSKYEAQYCRINHCVHSVYKRAFLYTHAQYIIFKNIEKARILYTKPSIYYELSKNIENDAKSIFLHNFYFIDYKDTGLQSKFDWLTDCPSRYSIVDWIDWYNKKFNEKLNIGNFIPQNYNEKNYAIITPTYINHFPFIKKYLQSFVKYVVDKDKITLYFIISKNEKNDFETIIEPYKNKCNIKILFCEDLFKQYGIKLSADELLKKYGRFSFQTFKKLYAVLSIPEEKSLILDSESMWVQKTNMQQMFIDFFAKPRIYGSVLESKFRIGVNFNQMVKNVDYLLGENCPYWFLENYMWFYEKRIVQDLVKQYGNPIEMAEKLRLKNLNMKINENILSGIFEITLYQNFIYFNLQKYKYNFININKEMMNYLSLNEYNEYKNIFYKTLGGRCGLTEHVCLFLKKNNLKKLAKLFKNLHIKIFRCNRTDIKNYKLQKKFLKIVQPCILASSQDHCFGINNTLKNRLKIIAFSSKTAEKLKKHAKHFGMPIKKFVNWLLKPFSILFYCIKLLFKMLKYIKFILIG